MFQTLSLTVLIATDFSYGCDRSVGSVVAGVCQLPMLSVFDVSGADIECADRSCLLTFDFVEISPCVNGQQQFICDFVEATDVTEHYPDWVCILDDLNSEPCGYRTQWSGVQCDGIDIVGIDVSWQGLAGSCLLVVLPIVN